MIILSVFILIFIIISNFNTMATIGSFPKRLLASSRFWRSFLPYSLTRNISSHLGPLVYISMKIVRISSTYTLV